MWWISGGGLGIAMGLFLGALDNPMMQERMTGKQQFIFQAKQMGQRSWSSAKAFAVMGFVFSAAECVVEKVSWIWEWKYIFYIKHVSFFLLPIMWILFSFLFRHEQNMTSQIRLLLAVQLELLYQQKVTLFFIWFLSFIMFLSLINLYLSNDGQTWPDTPPMRCRSIIFLVKNQCWMTRSD